MPQPIIEQLKTLLSTLVPQTIESDQALFSSGILDSIALLEVVQVIEGHWGIRFHWSEVTLDNLDTMEKMASFVQKKQEA